MTNFSEKVTKHNEGMLLMKITFILGFWDVYRVVF